MNLQHERITHLCDTLKLPFVAQGYGAAAQQAAKDEMARFPGGAAAGGNGRTDCAQAEHDDAPGRLPVDQDAG